LPPARPRKLKFALLLALAVLIVAGIVFRGIHARIQTAAVVKEATQELAIPAVSVIHPKPGAMKNEVVLPGNIQAFTDSPIYARSSGYLKQWNVDIGGRVKAGQVLATIEAPELDQQVSQARATLQQARDSLNQALANQQQGKANEEIARVTAERWQNLVKKGAVSRQENDQYQAQYQAQAANVNALEQAIAASRSNIVAAEANLGRLQEMQNYETVRAPFDGIVTARNIDVGALVNAGNGGTSQELFHMAATAKLRVYVSVPQADSRAAVPGLKSYLTLAEFPGRRFPGELVRTSGAIDPATRTLLTEVDVDNASGELRPGAYAEVHLMIPEGSRALILPVSTLMFRSEGLRVGVVRDGKAELAPVVLGKDYGNEVEVVSGIAEDDLVISNPPDSLASGAPIQVVKASDVR
jgi:RND family efflux transporter MFP subunit